MIDHAWAEPNVDLMAWLATHRDNVLNAYRADPLLIPEHARQEDSFRTGGYANRQVLELVQNGADALQRSGHPGRMEVRLSGTTLYCANEGQPFTAQGLEAVTHAHLSGKRGDEIGRFGLGFKSVLGVSDAPAIFSRSVSFGFDRHRSRDALAAVRPEERLYPILRLPEHLDAPAAFASDPVLAELADWATTVVRLPLHEVTERLFKDLTDFPREFLLFTPSVQSLRITVEGSKGSTSTEHACTPIGEHGMRLLGADGDDSSDWLVWHRTHRPSVEALAEVGEALRREEVRVSYAAPLDDASSLGRFWAYFPLQDVTSTRGIHNAPWRINDDRTNLLAGTFNDELLEVIGDMVVAALPALSDPQDPARHFDYLPARGREAPNQADKYLTETIPPKARSTACVPDTEGLLRLPGDLFYPHADLRLELESYGLWDQAPARPKDSPSWTCYKTPTRRARLRSLVRPDDAKAVSTELGAAAWLERIAGDGDDGKVEAALRVVFSVRDESTRRDMLGAKILPDSAGGLHRLHSTKSLFLRGHALSQSAGLAFLRPSLLDRGDVAARLQSLGFKDADPQEELQRLLSTAGRKWTSSDWQGFWQLVEEVSTSEAQKILIDHVYGGSSLKVRCANGSWQETASVVVPGLIEPVNQALCLDVDYHELHLGLLKGLGVSVRPAVSKALMQDSTLLEYQRLQRDAYLKDMPPRGRPDAASLNFEQQEAVGPLHVLRRFGDGGDIEAQAQWTEELLQLDASARWRLVHVNHRTFPPRDVVAPHIWAAQTYGLLRSSWGPRPSPACLSHTLAEYAPLLPVASSAASAKVRTIASLEETPLDVWREFLARVPDTDDAWRLGDLLVEASRRIPASEQPAALPAIAAEPATVAPARLLIALDEEEVRALAARGLPHVAVRGEQAAARLCEQWGCSLASTMLQVEIVTETPGEPVVLLDRFRGLRPMSSGRLDGWELVECSDLARQITCPTGLDSEATDFARSGKTIFYVGTLTEEDLLERISADFELDLDSRTVSRVLSDAQDAQVKAKIALARAARSDARRLFALLPVTVLESSLPTGLLDTVRRLGDDMGEEQVAELLLHVHGYNVLSELRHVLDAAGFPVPSTWAGSSPAVAFVRSLGFPTEYAGVRGSSLDAEATVLGPPRLPPLHGYQVDLAQQIRDLVAIEQAPGRALLFLPTGAGKTRVTVEALVKAFTEDGFQGPLLWIAQTEELCEQAVQTWTTVWREFGDQPLRICRLWSSNEVAESEEALTVVVATDAKLEKCRDRDEYNWLQAAAAVIIDEAHTATGAGISDTLRWLGISNAGTARPLLGLTATPFKGTGEEANRILASRFGKRQLNVLGEDPYGHLQSLGVLARVEHRTLQGASFSLNAVEAQHVKTFNALPQAALERVGKDEERMQTLLRDITTLPEDWPVLVFTASVLSAQTLAALLRVQGVPAASVSGTSRMYDRRRSIDAFRRGDIRVLTNCSVLTQGFDAPAVRALYIAKPTFSPNAYIQMVGRGLRGPANGGKEECLVVNIADTFDQFGDKLAYKEFDYLWDARAGDER